jgi:PD-(D/E)XK nuclease superfamily
MTPLPVLSNMLTKSRLSAARQCQRKHDLQYRYGYRPAREADPLRLGTLIHLGLESLWSRGSFRYRDMFDAGVDPWDIARIIPMLEGYAARWGETDAEEYTILAVEKEFRCPLVNPATGKESQIWQLAGKLDKIVLEKSSNRILIMEHKSSGSDISPGSTYWSRLRMDSQVSIYYAGARSLGYDVSGVLYDVLGKPKLRPYEETPEENRKYKKDGELYANQRLNAETTDEFEKRCMEEIASDPNRYYQRGEVVRLAEEMDTALIDVWQLGQQLREAERMNRSPRNPDACEKWGTLCSFFGVCSGMESLDNLMLFQRSDNVHPELSLVEIGK